MGAATSGGENDGSGTGQSTPHSAYQAASMYSDIDTTKVDVGAHGSRIRAAQQPIPVHNAKIVHRIMDAHDCYVRVLVWDLFRDVLISGGGDGWIRLWSTKDYSFVDELEAKLSVRSFAVLTEELASGHSNGEVIIWDMADPRRPIQQQIRAHEEAVYGIVVLRSGELVTGAEDIRVFSKGIFGYGHVLTIEQEVLCMCAIPSSTEIVTGNMNSTILVWDSAKNWDVIHEGKGHERSVWTVAWVRECARCASGSADHTIRIWHPETWECERVLSDHTGWVVNLTCAPGLLASCSIDQGIRLWDVRTWRCQRTFTDQEYEVYCVCPLPHGRLCSGGAEMAIVVYGGPEHDRPERSHDGTSFPGVGSSRTLGSSASLSHGPEQVRRDRDKAKPPGTTTTTSPRGEPPKIKNAPSTWGGPQPALPPKSDTWMALPEWVAAPLASVTQALTPRSAAAAKDVKSGEQDRGREQADGYPSVHRVVAKPCEPQGPQQRRRQLQAATSELDFTMTDFREHLVEVEAKAKIRQRSQSREARAPGAGSCTGASPKFGQGSAPRAGRSISPKPLHKAGLKNEDDMLFETWTAVPNARDIGLQPSGKQPGAEGVTEWSSALLSRGRSPR